MIVKRRMLRLGGPQDRVTDHRINKSWGNLEAIVDGSLDKIIEATKQISRPNN